MNRPGTSTPGEAGRGTLRGEIAFAFAALRLLASLILETAWNFLNLLLFFAVRRRWSERVRRIVTGGSAVRAAVLGTIAAAGIAVLGGCASKPMTIEEPTGDSRSLNGEIEGLRWTWRALADQSDSKKSFEEDLETLKTDPHWKDSLRFDAEHLFLAPDARKSLEEDLQTLGEPDWKKHGLRETLEMLGW